MADLNRYGKELEIRPVVSEEAKQALNRQFADTAKKFGSSFVDSLKSSLGAKNVSQLGASIGKSKVDTLLNTLKEGWQELNNMLSYSSLSNPQYRELAFGYGLTGAQAYGLEKAQDITGLSTEDLMYSTPQERKKFQEYMTKYSEQYSKLYDSGYFEQMREFNYEMQDFKQEVTSEVVEFFMNNKDTIKQGLIAIIDLTNKVTSALSTIVSFITGGQSESEMTAKTRDIISQYGGQRINNTNVSIDNTFNNVAQNDQTWLANAGQMTYEQIIRALT